jgi:hypothetical protein
MINRYFRAKCIVSSQKRPQTWPTPLSACVSLANGIPTKRLTPIVYTAISQNEYQITSDYLW